MSDVQEVTREDTQSNAMYVETEKDGERLLGIRTGIRANSFALRRLTGGTTRSGYVVKNGEVHEWRSTGFREEDGEVTLLGPLVTGRALLDRIESAEPEEREPLLRRIVSLTRDIKALLDHTGFEPKKTPRKAVTTGPTRGAKSMVRPDSGPSHPYERLHGKAVMLADDGGAFFLPPPLLEILRDNQNIGEQLRLFEYLNHPERSGEDNLCFFVAVLIYRLLSGAYPFEDVDSESVHARMRDTKPLYLRYRLPEVSPALAGLIGEVLDPTAPEKYDLSSFADALEAAGDTGFFVEVGDEERAQLAEQAEIKAKRADTNYRRREAVRKNWRRAAIITVIAVVIGSIPATIISNHLAPRRTAGLPPEEVIEAYYLGMNQLDHDLMEDAIVEDAGRPEINEAMNLFVLSRMRMSAEGQSGMVDPQQWLDADRPELPPTVHLYGVSGLQVSPDFRSDEEAGFVVDYVKWMPDSPNVEEIDVNTRAESLAFDRRDRVLLRRDREDWVIYQLDRLEDELLGPVSQVDNELLSEAQQE